MPAAPKKLLFGTAGVPLSTSDTSTFRAIERIHELGLDCLEIEFVKGVKMGYATAAKIKEKALSLGIRLSVHAPYYINLNSADQGKKLSSHERLLNSARLAGACGARSVVFHAGYYGQDDPRVVYQTIRGELAKVVSILRTERIPVTLRIETMGKKSQFGSLEEVLFLCRETEGLQPCLDFSHIHSREGKFNTYLDFHRVLSKLRKKLGTSAIKNVHIHISGIEYGQRGELKHLDLVESDFRFDDWVQALKDLDVEGMVICESPNLEADALMLKKLYWAQRLKD